MKTLKFRVWRYCHRIDKFKFYYLNHLKICTNSGADICFQETDVNYCDDSVEYPEKIVIQQFTGLVDKQDKEIYEGDILNWDKGYMYPEMTGKIVWKVNGFLFSNKMVNWILPRKSHNAKIIGNIYETPELLKQEK